ncbi:redoxin domain-containing protein [Winogradskyella sp. 3972H.M.0a.05]|uniref:redoxin domain-containing protein n=1 Tax=Winogradskyella sp. 3972H.M.0a.05 TaxID=2950277 RepID=UPI003392E78B
MKNLSILLVLTLLFSSCKDEPKRDSYIITANAPGVYNGIRAYLKVSGDKGRQIPVDTAIVMNEAFTFEGKAESPGMYFITIDNVRGSVQLVLENDDIVVDIDKDVIAKSKITGSEATDLFTTFNDNLMAKRKDVQQLLGEQRQANYAKDEELLKTLQEKISAKNEELKNFGYDFVSQNPESVVSLILLEQQSKSKDVDTERFMNSFEELDDDLKNSKKGTVVKTKMLAHIEKQKKSEALQIGKKAPLFTAPDKDGNKIALNDIKGKVTIVDFWASWCGPCRRENPNVVRVYEQYHDKGLEIIGVSLDRANQKDRWLKAIEDDKLNWHHVSNLSYFNDPVARLYNISSIPATYILDENGTIVAKNLRGPALGLKVAELLNN